MARAGHRAATGPAAYTTGSHGCTRAGWKRGKGTRRQKGPLKGAVCAPWRPISPGTTSWTWGPTEGGVEYARGDVIIVRYAADCIVGFAHRDDAERFWRALRDRLGQCNLQLPPEKKRG